MVCKSNREVKIYGFGIFRFVEMLEWAINVNGCNSPKCRWLQTPLRAAALTEWMPSNHLQ